MKKLSRKANKVSFARTARLTHGKNAAPKLKGGHRL